jgi:hypothetical protein
MAFADWRCQEGGHIRKANGRRFSKCWELRTLDLAHDVGNRGIEPREKMRDAATGRDAPEIIDKTTICDVKVRMCSSDR